ncbi:MAG: DUF4350 domain-containing protein [Haliscomenobacteraceae bacterium CHB4]|nr:hypothetical protein [Saprospiraceae bacterium]MCE7923304.1 DUF4350 domain-containing protein [Haliscomenobacteraceae bacterium CHB4]
MSSNRTPLIIALLALILLAAAFYFTYESGQPKFDWSDSWSKKAYRETNAEPYGTQIVHRLLEKYFPGKQLKDIQSSIIRELPLDSTGGSNYIFIGEAMYMDSASTEHLLRFVEAGNTVFLASKTIPFDLMFKLYYRECPEAEWNDYSYFSDTLVRMTLREPKMAAPEVAIFHYARQNQPVSYNWHFIAGQYFCPPLPHHPLGYVNDSLVNFARYPYGQGYFLLHTNPLVFSNYSLLRTGTRLYLEGVLSWLREGDIYWDAMSRVPEAVARRRNRSAFSRTLDEEHPLSYILKQPALAWAWYLVAGLALTWLIFRAKRRQRVIPVLPKNENSSYEFISTIANLHFREKNYQGLCIQSMKLFIAQIRERYGLLAHLDHETLRPHTDHDFFQRLAAVSEVPESQVRDIFTQYTAAVQYQPTEEMMVNLHLAMERFWKKAK